MNDFLKLIVIQPENNPAYQRKAVIINLKSTNRYRSIIDLGAELRGDFNLSIDECYVDILSEGRFTNNQYMYANLPVNKTSPDWTLIDYADFQMLYGKF